MSRHGAFGIIFSPQKDKVLLILRRDVPIWVLPGGGIEHGETSEQAVIREVFEESGYKVNVVRKVGEYFINAKNKTNHLFECSITSGEATLSNESSAVEFHSLSSFPYNIHPISIKYINDALLSSENLIKKDMYIQNSQLFLKAWAKRPDLLLRFWFTFRVKPMFKKLFFSSN